MVLTQLEQKVFDALKANSENNGGDFACAEEVNVKQLGLTRQQFGALLTTLESKKAISVDITYVNGSYRSKGDKVTQVTFNDAAEVL